MHSLGFRKKDAAVVSQRSNYLMLCQHACCYLAAVCIDTCQTQQDQVVSTVLWSACYSQEDVFDVLRWLDQALIAFCDFDAAHNVSCHSAETMLRGLTGVVKRMFLMCYDGLTEF